MQMVLPAQVQRAHHRVGRDRVTGVEVRRVGHVPVDDGVTAHPHPHAVGLRVARVAFDELARDPGCHRHGFHRVTEIQPTVQPLGVAVPAQALFPQVVGEHVIAVILPPVRFFQWHRQAREQLVHQRQGLHQRQAILEQRHARRHGPVGEFLRCVQVLFSPVCAAFGAPTCVMLPPHIVVGHRAGCAAHRDLFAGQQPLEMPPAQARHAPHADLLVPCLEREGLRQVFHRGFFHWRGQRGRVDQVDFRIIELLFSTPAVCVPPPDVTVGFGAGGRVHIQVHARLQPAPVRGIQARRAAHAHRLRDVERLDHQNGAGGQRRGGCFGLAGRVTQVDFAGVGQAALGAPASRVLPPDIAVCFGAGGGIHRHAFSGAQPADMRPMQPGGAAHPHLIHHRKFAHHQWWLRFGRLFGGWAFWLGCGGDTIKGRDRGCFDTVKIHQPPI